MFAILMLLLFVQPILVKSIGKFKQVLDFSDPGMLFSNFKSNILRRLSVDKESILPIFDLFSYLIFNVKFECL